MYFPLATPCAPNYASLAVVAPVSVVIVGSIVLRGSLFMYMYVINHKTLCLIS
jgi:hypothetical protein